jgi:hypothetical protein
MEGQDFSRSYDWLLAHPLHPRSPVSKLDGRHKGRPRKRDNLPTGRGGEGRAKSRIIRPQYSLVRINNNSVWAVKLLDNIFSGLLLAHLV